MLEAAVLGAIMLACRDPPPLPCLESGMASGGLGRAVPLRSWTPATFPHFAEIVFPAEMLVLIHNQKVSSYGTRVRVQRVAQNSKIKAKKVPNFSAPVLSEAWVWWPTEPSSDATLGARVRSLCTALCMPGGVLGPGQRALRSHI